LSKSSLGLDELLSSLFPSLFGFVVSSVISY